MQILRLILCFLVHYTCVSQYISTHALDFFLHKYAGKGLKRIQCNILSIIASLSTDFQNMLNNLIFD